MEDNQLVTASVAANYIGAATNLPDNKCITNGELKDLFDNMEVIPLRLTKTLAGGSDCNAIFTNFRDTACGYVGIQSNGTLREYDLQESNVTKILSLRYDEMDGQNFTVSIEGGWDGVDVTIFTSDDNGGAEYHSLSRISGQNNRYISLNRTHNSIIMIIDIY